MKQIEEIQLADIETNIHKVIETVMHSRKPVVIFDKDAALVRIVPVAQPRRSSWLGSMQGTGRIVGDILSPAEDTDSWEALSEKVS